jgi:penicillin-binding protein 1B
VGSLIKPAIYVTALASRRYTLATPLADSSFSIKTADGKAWSPQNYDHQSHGEVALITALAQSYNLATARLGLSLGVPQVVDTLNKLGVERPLQAYPSLLLGAAALTPIEVTQVYQSLAAGGFRTPLRSIREVLTAEGKPLARYPLAVEQVLKPADAYLISRALQEVVRSGTGRSLAGPLRGLSPAGKTGTTNDLRDSWFAGYTGDYLAVVWVGRDDNQSCRLSGAAGAMQVWGDIMQRIGPQALRLVQPPDVEFVWVDAQGRRADSYCEGAMQLPFVLGTVPQRLSPCVEEPEPVAAPQPGSKPVNEVLDWIRGLMR